MRPLNYDPAEKFDYYQSQVAALQIDYSENIDELARGQVTEILDYYAQRYQPWEARGVDGVEVVEGVTRFS
jgi:protein associated with RNAse G/E